ncbi:baseplate J/gp47 family protein [Bradyrhizobium sp. SZCCHNRI2007]|uniref:baseplate J/gp47 family protein n=1 Tax=Bradyrhizobium sp. SZCCHNRI2007 TaxID=3057281 RepID=UPI0028E4FDDE|nr:baseplate J/gp47 family protein [Bradyrhizobium sp. SZCCHNRI2007]
MFDIPSLLDLVQRARDRFRANLPGSDAWIWPNNLNPTAKVIGGMTHEVFGFADYIQRQKFALTADGENLDLHGAELGIARRPAAPARGDVTISAAAAITVDPAALFQRSDGIQFRALAGGSLAGPGTVDVEVIATTNGQTTTTIAGTDLAIVSGVNGDDAATAQASAGGIGGGTDDEIDGEPFTDDLGTYRGRILFRKRNPPHGGAAADYVSWALEMAGVTRVFVERLAAGVGTVRVFVLMDDLYLNGIAPASAIAGVADHISRLQPAGARVSVVAPTALPVDIQIAGLTPSTTAVQEAVLTELRDMFRRLSRVAGIDRQIGNMPYLAYPASFSRSWIWQAVANATGEQRHILNFPEADIAQLPGQIPTLGRVSFV